MIRRIVYQFLAETARIGFALWRSSIERMEEVADADHYQQAALLSCAFCTGDDDETACETRSESESSTAGASKCQESTSN